MKKLIILTLFFLSGCYTKRIETLEKNQQTIVQVINAMGAKMMQSETKKR
jgi:hypothetical protein